MSTATSASDLTTLRARLSELFDSYAAHVDHGRLEEWAALFAEESRYEVRTRNNVESGLPIALVLDDTKDRILDRITVVRKFWRGHHEEQFVRHLWSAMDVVSVNDDVATVRSNLVVYGCRRSGPPFIMAMGECVDEVDLESMLFRSRVITLDQAAIHGAFIDPI